MRLPLYTNTVLYYSIELRGQLGLKEEPTLFLPYPLQLPLLKNKSQPEGNYIISI